jgi:hypothetical protein
MTMHTCSHCGNRFELPKAMGPIERFLGRREKYIPLDEHLTVTCPNCGNRESATQREFFGFAGPKAIRAVIVIMLIGVIVFIIYDLAR